MFVCFSMLDFNRRERVTPSFSRHHFLRLLSMGCGISKFEPKEVVEATADCPHNPPRSHKSSTTNCFTGEPKPSVQEGSTTEKQSRKGNGSSRDREVAGEKMVKMSVNVKREKVEEDDRQMETMTQINFEDPNDDQNYRKIFRGGSPSFREYCIGSKSRSRSIGSEGNVLNQSISNSGNNMVVVLTITIDFILQQITTTEIMACGRTNER